MIGQKAGLRIIFFSGSNVGKEETAVFVAHPNCCWMRQQTYEQYKPTFTPTRPQGSVIEPMTFALLHHSCMCAVFKSQKCERQSSLWSQFVISALRETEEKSWRLCLCLLTPKSANNSCAPDLWNQTRAFVFAARPQLHQCTKSIFIRLSFHE